MEYNLLSDHVLNVNLVKVCALTVDLEILEDGDEAEIGERGVCSTIVLMTIY